MVKASKQIRFNLTIYVLISLIIHIIVLSLYVPQNGFESILLDKSKVLKVKIVSEMLSKPRQIVDTEKSKENIKKDSKFLSETNSYFERQTRAKEVGSFKKAGVGSKQGLDENQKGQKVTKKQISKKEISFSDLSLSANNIPLPKKSQSVSKGLKNGSLKEKGFSQSSDFVKDMPLGDFTRLNTQEYEFYGFYHRIRLKLEQFWGRNIQDQANKIFKSGRSIASNKNHITSLVIQINENGSIIGVHIKSTSGVKELDEAAVQSFNQAGPFPNPPKKMLKNGIATIEWSFVVNS